MNRPADLLRALGAMLAMLLASACVQLPTEGPVQDGPTRGTPRLDEGFPYEPRPPQPGETPQEIVRHFLDAMTANPITTSVARQFLSPEARSAWNPEERMITYADVSSPSGTSDVEVTLIDANHLDSRGSWRGALPDHAATISFPMTVVDGEWRIDRVPDAMIVSDSWFDERYRQVSLYFFDAAGEILVPEPVFVPRGGQLSTALMRGLVRGPGDQLRGVSRSFFPEGWTLDDLSVPVTPAGLAEVSLKGALAAIDPETLELMTAQIAWTLRQDPTVERVRVTVGDTPITDSSSGADFSVLVGEVYDPNGVYASSDLFGLRNGRLVSTREGTEVRVDGPLGRRRLGLRDVSVDLPAERVAGVTGDGRSLLVAPVTGPGRVRTVVSGADDLLHPAWDHAGRLWLVDRTLTGAAVSVVVEGRRRTVRVPGVTGEDVIDFLVSRDGTRFIAALDRPGSDVVVQSRITRVGGRTRVTPARRILEGVGAQLALRDLGWRAPTEVAVLSALGEGISEVRTFSVDGSPVITSGESTELLRDDITRLVSAPTPETAAWVVPRRAAPYQLAPEVDSAIPLEGLEALTYVG